MTTLQQIRELTIRGRSEGLDKVAGDLQRVGQAAEAVGKVTETSARRQLSAASAFERLSAQIDPAYRAQQQFARGQNTIDRALEQGIITANQYAVALDKLRSKYKPMEAANSNLARQTDNIAAQFQDVAVQLAAGQSPFLIALQQGTQLSSVLGSTGGGLRGTVAALGGAFASLISPVSLVTIGLIAAGGAAVQYFTSGSQQAQSLDDKLKAHSDIIARIKDAYGEAASGLEDYASRSRAVLEVQLRASMDRLTAELREKAAEIHRALSVTTPAFSDIASGAGFGGIDYGSALPQYRAFEEAITRFRTEARNGAGDVLALRQAVADLALAAGNDANLRKMADEILAATNDAAKLEEMLQQARRAVDMMGAAAAGNAAKVKEFNAALKALSQMGLPDTPMDRARAEYERMRDSATTAAGRASADEAYLAAVDRLKQREAEKAAEEAQRRAEAAARRSANKADNSWESSVRQVEDHTRRLYEQAQTYGMAAREVERFRAEQELLTAAQRAFGGVTPEIRAEIARLADAAGAAAQRMEELRERARFDHEMQSMAGDAIKGIVSDLRSGASAAEAFTNALNRIADKLIDMAINDLVANAFGGRGGAGGGFLSALLRGFSGGGIPTMAQGGYGPDMPMGFASGGWIRGPGTATSDSIPARLSNGEFVVRARAAAQHAELLEAINSGRVRAYADGGFVGKPANDVWAATPAPSATAPKTEVNILPPDGYKAQVTETNGPKGPALLVQFEQVFRGMIQDGRFDRDLARRMQMRGRG